MSCTLPTQRFAVRARPAGLCRIPRGCLRLFTTIACLGLCFHTLFAQNVPDSSSGTQADSSRLPHATPLEPTRAPDRTEIESDNATRDGELFTLSGTVIITTRDRTLRADKVTFNRETGEATAEGHVTLSGGDTAEVIHASHGTVNIRTGLGRFYDVDGSIAPARAGEAAIIMPDAGSNTMQQRDAYSNSNPLLFAGKIVVKTGPANYEIYDGWVTSCQLPRPDWELLSKRFRIDDKHAVATSSTFKLIGVPILFLPYVTHPSDEEQRQSGFLIPVFGYSSASQDTGSKGFTIGDQFYIRLTRSADATIGLLYYTLRGYSQNGTVRIRGTGDNFITAHFSALQDRGFDTSYTTTDSNGNQITVPYHANQGGQDVTTSLRLRLNPETRIVASGEYLSTYIYRQVFTENFNQAVSSDILSSVQLVHQANGLSLDLHADRYLGLKVVQLGPTPGEEVKIFHAPSIAGTLVDRRLGHSPFLFSLSAEAAGLKRVQPNFVTSGIIERFDVRPEIALPLSAGGWHAVASIAAEETAYSRSRLTPYGVGVLPVELTTPLSRASADLKVDIRPPVFGRDFTVPPTLQRWFGTEVRHTIEPQVVYRKISGVNDFLSVLRFDTTDLLANTNELEYGVTQHVYMKTKPVATNAVPGCEATGTEATPAGESDATIDANGVPVATADAAPIAPPVTHAHRRNCPQPAVQQQELFSWRLTQKTFFDESFGGAVINTRRNIFTSTLDLSGIAFLTEPRNISPLVSRLRVRTSNHTDVEWNFDLDTGASKFTSSNLFLDAHGRNTFGGIAYARLNAPGRFRTEQIDKVTNSTTIANSPVSDFNQLRFLLGYGSPSRAGLAVAGSSGVDLNLGTAQYVTIQASYNWNCCGLTVEYRKFDLGTLRNDGTYRFNFTLANIGSAGNLRRTDALF